MTDPSLARTLSQLVSIAAETVAFDASSRTLSDVMDTAVALVVEIEAWVIWAEAPLPEVPVQLLDPAGVIACAALELCGSRGDAWVALTAERIGMAAQEARRVS